MHDNAASRVSRRQLLTGAAGLLGLAVAPGVALLRPAPAAADSSAGADGADPEARWGLLVDGNRCAEGCEACVRACRDEHGWQPGERPERTPQWIRKLRVQRADGGERTLPLMCQHCSHPPCVHVCPTGASFQRADGIVLVDKHDCIGCRYCVVACPFQARFIPDRPTDPEASAYPRGKGAAESCTLCVHRIDRGELPACVERCAEAGNAALVFGDLNDPDSDIRRALARYGARALRPELGLEPGVRYHDPA